MIDQLLELELQLMVIRHGREKLIAALARVGSRSVEEIEREIALLAERRATAKDVRKKRSAADLIGEMTRGRPELQALVTPMIIRYENRTFLPQLRDVMRFLDGAGIQHGKLKSRADGLPQVIAALSERSPDELRRLAAPSPGDTDSDFLMLAREIMAGGRPRRPKKGEAD